jgi:hypothetical protein
MVTTAGSFATESWALAAGATPIVQTQTSAMFR